MSALAGPLHLVAFVLLLSGVQKLAQPRPAAQAMRDAGLPVPRRAVTSVGRALGLVEVATGLAVLALPAAAPAAWMAVFYLGLAGFVLQLRRRDDTAGCGCFGASSAPPTIAHVIANVTAAAVAGAAALTGVPDIVDIWREGVGVVVPYGLLVAVGGVLTLLGPTLLAELSSTSAGRDTPAGVRPFGPTTGAAR